MARTDWYFLETGWLRARIEYLVARAVFADSWPLDNDEATASRLRSFLSGEILEWMASRWSVTTDADKRAVLAVSWLYDGPNLATARQALTAAGRTVDYIEVPEGHNQGTWRNHLRDVLVSLFGRQQVRTQLSTTSSGSR